MNKTTKLITALDTNSKDQVINLINKLGDACEWYKIGSQLFCLEGPEIIKYLKDRNKKVFLDLKFHDIPNTVANVISVCADYKVDMLNIHAGGGKEMMEAAWNIIAKRKKQNLHTPLLVAVTVLTSIDSKELQIILNSNQISYTPRDHVKYLAKLAKNSGLHGVVCSSHEINTIKKFCGQDFILVVPGIRPQKHQQDDQKRIMTPSEAANAGADFIVVGRPIIEAENPAKACREILSELN